MKKAMSACSGLALLLFGFALFASSAHADPQTIPIEAVEVVDSPPASDPAPSPPDTPAPAPPKPSGPLLYDDYFTSLFGEQNIKVSGKPLGSTVQLQLDNTTGSGFRSKNSYLYGHLSMKLKLVAGNSAGTVTSYYLASNFTNWSELDFEFLGNVTGEPYILQTNVFSDGKGEREQRMYLWFDPSADYHEYGIIWNEKLLLFLVDDVVIRVFYNVEKELKVPYLTYQPMYIYSSIWDGSTWATRGGADKADWEKQPFVASYTGFDLLDACPVTDDKQVNQCYGQASTAWYNDAAHQTLTQKQIDDLKNIKYNYIKYDYCTDYERFPIAPPECAVNWPF